MLQASHKKLILNVIFSRIPKEECVVFLFGSNASRETIRGSDIDIGLLCNRPINAANFIEIQEELNNNLPLLKKIDLVDFSTVSKKVKTEALKETEIWHIGKNCRELLKNLKRA